jgi:uncharacterized RDD family membrane protein YckC
MRKKERDSVSTPITTITCPQCGFSRQVPTERLPRGEARATCPRCHENFTWPGLRDLKNGQNSVEPPSSQEIREAVDYVPRQPSQKAGFWLRTVAALIDTFLISLAQGILGGLLDLSVHALIVDSPDRVLNMFIFGLFNFALWQAYKVFFTGYCGQTPGKMALRIKVVKTDFADLGFLRAFWREVVGKFLATLFFGLGFLLVAIDPEKQGLHDRMAATYVVKL